MLRAACCILTLAGTRHFAILQGTGGGGVRSTPLAFVSWVSQSSDSKTSVLLVTRRSHWHPSLRSWVNRWPPEVRSMTKNWPKCDFADNFVSEQARAAIERPERSLRSLEYYAMPFGLLLTVFGVKIKQNSKNGHFSFGYFSAPMNEWMTKWMTNGCQIQNQRTKLPLGAQNPEKWHDVIKGHWPLMTSVHLGKVTMSV